MYNTIETLLLGSIILLVLGYLFWPDIGFLAKMKAMKKHSLKIQIEDALKHLFDFEDNGMDVTLHSLAGHLSVSGDEAAVIAEKLKEMNLVTLQNEILRLTGEGRTYALKIIRIHRLYERYLADETGVHEKDWHLEAEAKEHFIDAEEAERLAAQMGNPLFDPHGDPIPTAKGELPEKKGHGLTEAVENGVYRITHIEDEPQAIYSQIVAEGLFPGMQIRISEKKEGSIKFIAQGEECLLSSMIAKNITVVPLQKKVKEESKYDTLSTLDVGETAEVIGISRACRKQQRTRLLDLGIVPGTRITSELQSMGKDPVAYYVKGTLIALRKNQSDYIYIRK